MRTRLLVLACLAVGAVTLQLGSASAAARHAAADKGAPAATDAGSPDEDATFDPHAKPKEVFVAPKAPKRIDKCGLTGARAQDPFAPGAGVLKSAWDDEAKIGRGLLSSGDYVWVDLKNCEKYQVTAKLIVARGPKSSDTRYWLTRAAEVAGALSGPILDDEAEALAHIAQGGRWFVRKTANGVSMEFPMAQEHIRFSATVTDYDDFSVLTLQQDAA